MIHHLASLIVELAFSLANDLLERGVLKVRVRQELIERVNIALEVLAVVILNRLSADYWLKRIVCIGKLY